MLKIIGIYGYYGFFHARGGIGVLTTLYSRLVKRKFFNRLLLTYTFIIVTTIVFLSATIIGNLNRSSKQDAANSTEQAVQRVQSYLEQKVNTAKLLIQYLYINPIQSQDMMDFLSDPSQAYTSDNIAKANLLSYFLDSAVSMDDDLLDAVVYTRSNSGFFFRSKDLTLNTADYLNRNRTLYATMDNDFYGLTITPSYNQTYGLSGQKRIFTIAANIRGNVKSKSFDKSIAVFTLNFNTARISAMIGSQLDRRYAADILILTNDGRVVYDSSERYYDRTYPYFDRVQTSDGNAMLDRKALVRTAVYDYLGFRVVGILPLSQLADRTQSERNAVIIISAIGAAVALVLSLISIRLFSRRVRIINKAIQKIQNGDLTYRIVVNQTNDEVSMIAANLNDMCDRLSAYIDRVYISELKQKDADLYALQSQVDPHFLYNTLEVIRMEALDAGCDHVGCMIESLAGLFRSSIKGDMAVRIRDELKFCSDYLELFNIRYAGQLNIEFDIQPDILDYGILKHLLQPIVENALVHGFTYNRADHRMIVKGCKDEEDIVIEIIDNGNGMEREQLEKIRFLLDNGGSRTSSNVGIANVNHRIRLLCGSSYGVAIDSVKDEGTTVSIRIPTKTKEAWLEHVQGIAG